jgi:hypothetical protein
MKYTPMLGRGLACCSYGCCTLGPPKKMKRVLKRRERQAWKREVRAITA